MSKLDLDGRVSALERDMMMVKTKLNLMGKEDRNSEVERESERIMSAQEQWFWFLLSQVPAWISIWISTNE
jgi:hypothetical protein